MLSRSLRSVSTSVSGITVRGYKKTIEQLAKEKPGLLKNANVLVRVDFNVPLDKKNPSKINDDTRIREALPTINFLSNAGAKVILASHCGRPDGKRNDAMKMAPMAQRLSELIKKPVVAVNDCIGSEVDASVAKMNSGDVIMLENARFYPEEEKNEPGFAAKLAKNAKIYVNDAFGTAHRAHASTEGVCKFVDHKVAGFLLEKEIKFLKGAVDAPKRPFAAIVGGAKVSTKIDVITSLIQKCDKIFIGGAMMFTFYRAMGLSTGKSMVEEKEIDKAKMLMDMAKSKGVKFLLPTDVVIAKEAKQEAESKTVSVKDIPADWIGLDIGSESLATFQKELADCKTIVWNGPMGLFEVKKFSTGTFGVAQTMADLTSKGAITIVGGGDSVAAVAQAGLESRMSHISTGGGASLEMLEGKVLPGVAALDDA